MVQVRIFDAICKSQEVTGPQKNSAEEALEDVLNCNNKDIFCTHYLEWLFATFPQLTVEEFIHCLEEADLSGPAHTLRTSLGMLKRKVVDDEITFDDMKKLIPFLQELTSTDLNQLAIHLLASNITLKVDQSIESLKLMLTKAINNSSNKERGNPLL